MSTFVDARCDASLLAGAETGGTEDGAEIDDGMGCYIDVEAWIVLPGPRAVRRQTAQSRCDGMRAGSLRCFYVNGRAGAAASGLARADAMVTKRKSAIAILSDAAWRRRRVIMRHANYGCYLALKLMKTGYKLHLGESPLLISIPHVGTSIPDALRHRYSAAGLTVQDTDWHLDQLYDFARDLGATILCAEYSRYVIDLNRPRNDASLYPGKITTGLCPTETFLGEDVYLPGQAPDATHKAERVAQYWQPYHDALVQQITRLREQHSHIVVWEAHSIKSRLPRLFDGKLWDLNLGTADGKSAASAVSDAVMQVTGADSTYTSVLNGRFKGGYITRQYGAPDHGVHTVQLEKCWSTYMHEDAPYDYAPERAAQLQPLLRGMLQAAVAALPTHATPAPAYPA